MEAETQARAYLMARFIQQQGVKISNKVKMFLLAKVSSYSGKLREFKLFRKFIKVSITTGSLRVLLFT